MFSQRFLCWIKFFTEVSLLKNVFTEVSLLKNVFTEVSLWIMFFTEVSLFNYVLQRFLCWIMFSTEVSLLKYIFTEVSVLSCFLQRFMCWIMFLQRFLCFAKLFFTEVNVLNYVVYRGFYNSNYSNYYRIHKHCPNKHFYSRPSW